MYQEEDNSGTVTPEMIADLVEAMSMPDAGITIVFSDGESVE